MNLSQEEEADMLDKLSKDKAIELIPVSLYVVVMMLTGLCGNVLVCLFYSKKGRVTPTTRLIVAAAIIDTIICIMMPKNIITLALSYKFTSSALCKIANLVNHSTSVSSAFVLVAVAAFRFRAVCKPFSKQFSLRHANIAIAMAISLSTVFALPVLFTQESVSINITVSSDLTIKGYDCNTSKKPSLKPLNLAVNVLHFFLFISVTVIFVVLYGIMGMDIMKYYRKKKNLTGAKASSVRSTSEHTSTSGIESANTLHAEDHFDEQTSTFDDVINDEHLKQRHENMHAEHAPADRFIEDGFDKYDCETQDHIALREIEAPNRDNIDEERKENERSEAGNDVDRSENNGGVKHTFVTIDKDSKKSEYQSKDRVAKPDKEETNTLFAIAVRQTFMLSIITLILFLSFLPYITMNLIRTLSKNKDGDDDFTNWIQFCTFSYLINSAANPFVYGLFNAEFRKFVKQTFCRCYNK